MTREEAIEKLKSQQNVTCNGCLHSVGWCESHCKFSEAIDMAIEALKQPEPCGDVVSRQAAIETAKDWYEGLICGSVNGLIKRLNALPTVQPEPKKGEWIEISSINHTYKCSECGRLLVNVADGRNNVSKHYPYCHCGADMKGERQK